MLTIPCGTLVLWHQRKRVSSNWSLSTWWIIVQVSVVSSAIVPIELDESLEKDIFAVHNVLLHIVFIYLDSCI